METEIVVEVLVPGTLTERTRHPMGGNSNQGGFDYARVWQDFLQLKQQAINYRIDIETDLPQIVRLEQQLLRRRGFQIAAKDADNDMANIVPPAEDEEEAEELLRSSKKEALASSQKEAGKKKSGSSKDPGGKRKSSSKDGGGSGGKDGSGSGKDGKSGTVNPLSISLYDTPLIDRPPHKTQPSLNGV